MTNKLNCIALLTLMFGLFARSEKEAKKPNIVIIMISV
jgi:hypothetical protein